VNAKFAMPKEIMELNEDWSLAVPYLRYYYLTEKRWKNKRAMWITNRRKWLKTCAEKSQEKSWTNRFLKNKNPRRFCRTSG
jgi:hypothetical protein